jgi:hypothetical protein
MDRRTAIAIAVAAGGTVLAAGAAFATNVGLLEPDQDQVGQLEPLNVGALVEGGASTTPETIVIDVPAPASATTTAGTAPAGTAGGGAGADDDHVEDRDDGRDDDRDDDHGDDGADDHGDDDHDDHDDGDDD